MRPEASSSSRQREDVLTTLIPKEAQSWVQNSRPDISTH